MLFPPRTHLEIVDAVLDNDVTIVTLKPTVYQNVKTYEEVVSSRKVGLKQLTSSLTWDIRNDASRNGELSGDQPSPGPVLDLDTAVALAIGEESGCALLVGGAARCWGNGANGRLGDGQAFTRHRPVPVAPGAESIFDWRQLVVGEEHACGLTLAGEVACWGSNLYDKLGQGGGSSKIPRVIPTLSAVTRLSAGHEHTCALHADTTVSCWGRNSSGQLGDGSTSTPAAPVMVQGLTGVTELSSGGFHTCALVGSSEEVWCWGSNADGQLGNGGAGTSAKVPVPVIWP